MNVKVSVIVPVYKTAEYLRKCLDSVLGQSLKESEIICINDGSPDCSLEILREYEKKNRQIIIIDKQNEGVGAARNDGIRMARGKYVFFLDSDDYLVHPDVLKHLTQAAEENNVKVCLGYCRIPLEDGTYEEKPKGIDGRAPYLKGLAHYAEYQYDYGFGAGIYDREMLIENNIFFPTYGRFQDPSFFVRALICADCFYAADEPVYYYRQVPDSGKISFRKLMEMLLGVQDNLKISKEHNLSRLHYITACRLEEDASYMAIKNLFHPENKRLMERMIQTTACVDTEWLKQEGYKIADPFLPEVFAYSLELAERYEKIRTSKILRALTWIHRKRKRTGR